MGWNEGLIGDLIDVVENEQEKAAKMIEENPGILELRNEMGETALHFIAIESFEKGVPFLLEKGANPNTTDEHGETVLSSATSLTIVRDLLNHGADPNGTNYMEESLIFTAIQRGNLEIIKLLVKFGVNLNVNDGCDTVLVSAIKWGHKKLVDYFLEQGLAPNVGLNEYGEFPLVCAVNKGNETIVASLLSNGANPNVLDELDEPILLDAIKNGRSSIVRLLLQYGAGIEINQEFLEILSDAEANGYFGLVQLFQEQGISLTLQNETQRHLPENSDNTRKIG